MTTRAQRWTAAAVAAAAACGFFVWGFASHRYGIFPYPWLLAASRHLGLTDPVLPRAAPEAAGAKEVEPRLEAMSVLRSLPYADAQPAERPQDRGVVLHDRKRSFLGVNFHNSTRKSLIQLSDMEGRTLHSWRLPERARDTLHHAELLPDGDVIATLQDVAVTRLDRNSEVRWFYPARAHHDVCVDEAGRIWFLGRESRAVPGIHPVKPIADDRLVVLTGDGKLVQERSLVDIVLQSPYAFLLSSIADREFPDGVTEIDLLHANHVQVFDGSLGERSPLFRRGNVLVSMKNINAIAILEAETWRILWLWGPNNVVLQHQPTLLASGRILLFDNGTEASRILELDPHTGRVTWSYRAGEEFFSFWGGASQRLPNGNTLITETDRGEAFEVTPEGEVVWRYLNPEVDEEGRRWNLWRMTRFSRDDLPFLGTANGGIVPSS